MLNDAIYRDAIQKFDAIYGAQPTTVSYAPGRVEVLGNHTDYNEGFVLSAAIDVGTFFLAAPTDDDACSIAAGDLMERVDFTLDNADPDPTTMWANYVKGVFVQLRDMAGIKTGFQGLFFGNIPLGSGLSSSAALEISAGLALSKRYRLTIDAMDMARIGQRAEHEYAGVKCGLMDQISSLKGQQDALVLTDFRSLDVDHVPLGGDTCLLLCNTNTKHALVDGAYNERREKCEQAAREFNGILNHDVTSLRDVSWSEWEQHASALDALASKRSAHPIGENRRVQEGKTALADGDVERFGTLMFESHESSVNYFENSCPELDFVVELCRKIPGVYGARLSGGGFGGSVVALVHKRDADAVGAALKTPYKRQFGHPCGIQITRPSDGACLLTD